MFLKVNWSQGPQEKDGVDLVPEPLNHHQSVERQAQLFSPAQIQKFHDASGHGNMGTALPQQLDAGGQRSARGQNIINRHNRIPSRHTSRLYFQGISPIF